MKSRLATPCSSQLNSAGDADLLHEKAARMRHPLVQLTAVIAALLAAAAAVVPSWPLATVQVVPPATLVTFPPYGTST